MSPRYLAHHGSAWADGGTAWEAIANASRATEVVVYENPIVMTRAGHPEIISYERRGVQHRSGDDVEIHWVDGPMPPPERGDDVWIYPADLPPYEATYICRSGDLHTVARADGSGLAHVPRFRISIRPPRMP